MQDRPWTLNQLKKLGICIRDQADILGGLPEYYEVMGWYNDLALDVQSKIMALPWDTIMPDRAVKVTSRSKTIDTLHQKLQRDHATPLPSIQDIAGVRVEADMNLDEQDLVVSGIAAAFPDGAPLVKDLRVGPHSGYRAVHVWLKLPSGRVEIQVRTHIQGAWANMYEAAGDRLGRDIRYGSIPAEPEAAQVVLALQDLSINTAALIESARTELDRGEIQDMSRTGSHKSSSSRSAMVRGRRGLRRQFKAQELKFKAGIEDLREMFYR